MRTELRDSLPGLLCPLFFLLFAAPVYAGFSVRNETPTRVWVAIGHFQQNGWCSSGWYPVLPGQTAVLLNGALNQPRYYLYAYDDNNIEWAGDFYFCTARQAFSAFPQQSFCRETNHEARGFFEVNTENQANVVYALQPRTDIQIKSLQPAQHQFVARSVDAKPAGCSAMSELSDASAQLLERFIDVALPQVLHRFTGQSLGQSAGATVDFTLSRNGPAIVRTSASGQSFGALTIDVPISLTDVRVDWTEQNRRRQRTLESATLMVHSTVELTRVNGQLHALLTNDYAWDYKPTADLNGRPIALGDLAEPYVNQLLQQAHVLWFSAVDPLLRQFSAQNCSWKPAATSTVRYLSQYNVNEVTAEKLREVLRAYVEQELRKN